MDETRRFGLALAGIGGCLCIAAGIVGSGLADVTAMPVPSLPTAGEPMLPRLPMPVWSDVPVHVATAHVTRKPRNATNGSGEAPTLAAAAPAPVHLPLDPFGTRGIDGARGRTVEVLGEAALVARPLEAAPVPLMLSYAPQAAGADVVVAAHRARERDAVTAAFVTAGTHVGKSVRTVGRTLKRVF